MSQTTMNPEASIVVTRRVTRRDRVARAGQFAPTILVFAALTAIALIASRVMPPWAAMWTTAFTIYAVCKVATWLHLTRAARTARPLRSAAYLLAWPGMNAAAFFQVKPTASALPAPSPSPLAWSVGIARLASGFALLTLACQPAVRARPLLAGWIGMFGLILCLHFGLFQLLALAWQSCGIPVEPIMSAPSGARSLGEFWSGRWNAAFRDLADTFVFRPVRRVSNTTVAMMSVFLISGLVHELVETVPARGGYGRPTAYFTLQGLAYLLEHSRIGRRIGLGRGIVGRLFAILVIVVPLPVLCFPPVFVHRVIVPFLDVLASFAHRVLPAVPVLLLIGGLLHFGILIASALVPGVLDWRRELAKLEPMTRHLVWVHGIFIVLTIVGLGVIATLNAPTLNSGTTIARSVCAFVAVFWGARLLIQVTLFDPSAFLTRPILSIGYQGLTIVFAYLTGVFGFAALRGLG